MCVGVARTKTLSKIANRLAKKTPDSGGLWLLDDPADIDARLAQIAVGDVWGIGRRYARFLHDRGIDTALQLARQPRDWVRRHLTIAGLHTVMELGQEPCIPFEENPPPANSLVCSRSFGERVSDLGSLEEALSTHVQRAAEKLRAKGCWPAPCRSSSRPAASGPRSTTPTAAASALAAPTAYTPDLHAAALRILRGIYRPGYAYQNIGVMLLDLVPEGARQLTFWDLPAEAARRARGADAGLGQGQRHLWPRNPRARRRGPGREAVAHAPGTPLPPLHHPLDRTARRPLNPEMASPDAAPCGSMMFNDEPRKRGKYRTMLFI